MIVRFRMNVKQDAHRIKREVQRERRQKRGKQNKRLTSSAARASNPAAKSDAAVSGPAPRPPACENNFKYESYFIARIKTCE